MGWPFYYRDPIAVDLLMKFDPLPLQGAYHVSAEPVSDNRGSFARIWCSDEARRAGIAAEFSQSSVSVNTKRGTLRGMHFQRPPHMEAKLVRCIRGRIFDAIVDIREDSPTFGKWYGTELSVDHFDALFIPKGFAHGYITLTDDAVLAYDISVSFKADHAAGIRWDDADIAIVWPIAPQVMSDRDRALPHLRDLYGNRCAPSVRRR